ECTLDGVKQVVRVRLRQWLAGGLAVVALAGEDAVGQPRRQLVAPYRLDRGETDQYLAAARAGGKAHRARGQLRLENRRHRLRALAGLVARPVELRGVERRQL